MSRRAAAQALASRSASIEAAAPPPDPPPGEVQTFAQWLASTNGAAGPDHYWPLDDASGTVMAADTGGLNGTWVNTGDLEFEITDAAGRKHVGFGGANGHGSITTPITTGAFTLMMGVQFDSAPAQMILASPDYVSTAGQFFASVIDDGAGGLKPSVASKDPNGVGVAYVGTVPGTVPVGTLLYFFYIRTASGGQQVWVYDVAAGTVSQIALTLNFGTPPGSWNAPPAGEVRIGTVSTLQSMLNGVARDLAIWDVALDSTDILALANIVPQPEPIVVYAKALDAGSVNESATLPDIPVLDNIHPSTGYALSVVDGAGTFGTLTTDGADLTYVAGAVTGDQVDSAMSWRISKGGVFSPTVGFSINVLEVGGGGTGVPFTHTAFNPFDEAGATIVNVSSLADLQTQVNNATGKKVIKIASGSYSGNLSFTRAAGSTTQVIIRPAGNRGDVTISNGTWTFADASAWIVVKDLYFSSHRLQLGGSHHRVTRCRFRSISGSSIRVRDSDSQHCRIDHCDFAGATSLNARILETGGISGWHSAGNYRMLYDHCYFHDWGQANSVSTGFAVPPTASYLNAVGDSVTYDHCLFNLPGTYSGEWIVNKLAGYVFRYCTFQNMGGYLSLPRSGNNCELRSCFFRNCGSAQMWGNNPLVIGNRFVGGVNCQAPVGNFTYLEIANAAGTSDPAAAGYPPCTNGSFIGNRFETGHIRIGYWWSSPPSVPADLRANNLTLQANTRDAGGAAHEFVNTTLNPGGTNVTVLPGTPTTPYDPAVELTTADVGLAAADPYG